MAQVTHRRKVLRTDEDWIDKLLRGSWESWNELPEVEREINSWDAIEAEAYLIEWNLEEMHLKDLKRYADEGKMTPWQRRSYDELMQLTKRNRPIVERLLGPTVTLAASVKEMKKTKTRP